MNKDGQEKQGAQRRLAKQELAFDPIEAALRQIHDHVVQEDIPDEFLKLLDELENGANGAGDPG